MLGKTLRLAPSKSLTSPETAFFSGRVAALFQLLQSLAKRFDGCGVYEWGV